MGERQFFTIKGKKATPEELDQLMETGDSESLLHDAVQQQGRKEIMDTVSDIQERHEAVREMERKLLELHQIFLDMAALVDQQGEMLDNIEANVSKSVNYMKDGTQALKEARSKQKSSRKWMVCAIVLMLIIVVVILATVVKPWESGDAR